MSVLSSQPAFDLAAAAAQEVEAAGFPVGFSPAAVTQTQQLAAEAQHLVAPSGLTDLRPQPWSSIDNTTSRDLDQIECAEDLPSGIRLHVAIADVAAVVEQGTALDLHAAAQPQTIYTAVRNFPMLPNELSTDITSLNQDADRRAVVLSFTVDPQGNLSDEQVSLAWVRNRAQLAYTDIGPWLDHASPTTSSAPAADKPSTAPPEPWLTAQLLLQDRAARQLRHARQAAGALDFKRAEADPVLLDGAVVDLQEVLQNRAMDLIEDLMVAANGVMARAIRHGGRSSLQRVVRVPARWDRIVALAAERGTTLPAQPDPVALNTFLQHQHQVDDAHYPELALAVIKLLGAGEYLLMRPDDDPAGHFGLAARDYTHSTAPNRRYPDLVTQRILRSMLGNTPAPYTDEELSSIAQECNQAGKAIRKIDRAMQKRVASVALASSVGKLFHGVVTGASPKGTYVRVFQPPFEGRITENEAGLDVGDCVEVKLLHTDPSRAFIDLARVSKSTC